MVIVFGGWCPPAALIAWEPTHTGGVEDFVH